MASRIYARACRARTDYEHTREPPDLDDRPRPQRQRGLAERAGANVMQKIREGRGHHRPVVSGKSIGSARFLALGPGVSGRALRRQHGRPKVH